jgi:hypothetical protein
MLAALRQLELEFSFTVEVVDVDSEPELERRYGELVPVLESGQKMLCHYFFDEPLVRQYLLSQ